MTQSMERAGVSRRSFIGGVGITAGGLMVASGPVLWQQAAQAATVTAEQVHLTFGADPAREVVVSWVTPTAVSNPAVVLGTYATGDTVTYMMRFTGARPIPNRPGRSLVEMSYEGVNQNGELVYSIDCSVVEFD